MTKMYSLVREFVNEYSCEHSFTNTRTKRYATNYTFICQLQRAAGYARLNQEMARIVKKKHDRDVIRAFNEEVGLWTKFTSEYCASTLLK